ncbi:hypothetical protein SK128_000111, partial [Halocaridina rubra]
TFNNLMNLTFLELTRGNLTDIPGGAFDFAGDAFDHLLLQNNSISNITVGAFK